MFKCVLAASILCSASGFVAHHAKNTGSLKIKSTSEPDASVNDAIPTPVVETFVPAPKVAKITRIPAKWLPVGGVMAPVALDGSLAGDVGFDPLGFAKSTKTLYWMREAEVKHGRLAMLAAVGWPLSELWHKQIADAFGLPSILAAGDRAPSIMNGGLSNPFSSGALIVSIMIAGLLEAKAMESGFIFWNSDKPAGYVPGDYNFDPLKLYGAKGDKKTMQTNEIKNGRLAMIAITAYAFQEVASGLPVVQETPYLF